VVITAGALFNTRDMVLSPDHRLFIYQREDHLVLGRSEVLVKVRHLINSTTVYQQHGRFLDYFQILFDDHQIIDAEGIAAETLLVGARTRAACPMVLAWLITSTRRIRHLKSPKASQIVPMWSPC
jgi:hypothetical protein